MGINIFGVGDWLDDLRDRKPVLGEIVKQAIDQPLHVLMGVASVWAIGAAVWFLGGFNEQVDPTTGVVLSSAVGGVLTAVWEALREWKQWPSSRWWDPPLDWLFEAGGIALGVWSWIQLVTVNLSPL